MRIIEKPSPNYETRRDGVAIGYIILHYTGMKSAAEALGKLTDPAGKVSAHYTVDEDGTIYRHVADDYRAWHAGKSFWQGNQDINSLSLGIEIVNPGHEWGYRPFPDGQIQAVANLCRELIARYDIPPENVLAHSDVAPDRKEDPGELFPWRALAGIGVGVWPSESDEAVVKSTGMDVDRALRDAGYDPQATPAQRLVAFQRHFEPEVFAQGAAGRVSARTRARLYAWLAGHWLPAAGGL